MKRLVGFCFFGCVHDDNVDSRSTWFTLQPEILQAAKMEGSSVALFPMVCPSNRFLQRRIELQAEVITAAGDAVFISIS